MFNTKSIYLLITLISLSGCFSKHVDNSVQPTQQKSEVQTKVSVPNSPPVKNFIPKSPVNKISETHVNKNPVTKTVHYAKFFTYQDVDIETEPTADIGTMSSLFEEEGCLLIGGGEVPVFPHGKTKWNKKTQTITWGRNYKVKIGKMFTYKEYVVENNTDEFKQYVANFVQKANPKCLENRDLIILE